MRLAFVVLLGMTILLGACGGGGGGKTSSGGGGTHTVPFDPDNAPATPPPIPDPGGQPFTFRILTWAFGWETVPQQLVARNETEYTELAARCNFADGDGAPPPGWKPPVDFDTEIVVAVFLGTVPDNQRPDIEGVSREGDGANVRWVRYVFTPPPTVTVSYTWEPYILAAMTRVEGPVTFTGRTEVVPYQ